MSSEFLNTPDIQKQAHEAWSYLDSLGVPRIEIFQTRDPSNIYEVEDALEEWKVGICAVPIQVRRMEAGFPGESDYSDFALIRYGDNSPCGGYVDESKRHPGLFINLDSAENVEFSQVELEGATVFQVGYMPSHEAIPEVPAEIYDSEYTEEFRAEFFEVFLKKAIKEGIIGPLSSIVNYYIQDNGLVYVERDLSDWAPGGIVYQATDYDILELSSLLGNVTDNNFIYQNDTSIEFTEKELVSNPIIEYGSPARDRAHCWRLVQ
jgi:hypothetical protein